jgi:glycosyltransferase involved in cell wall biosynthesis
LGYQKDPREYLSISDVLLVPSVAESFPMAILEALSMGKPVIASRVGGTSEVIREGVNGFLVEPKDTHSLMEKLNILIHDENARGRLARNARETVINDFSVSGMIQKTEAVLARLLDS